jgi:hypothetical protein
MRASLLTIVALSSSSFGCSDPPAPLAAGGWTISFSRSSAACNVPTHNEALGQVGQTGETELLTDGVNNASVDCSVTPKSGGFAVRASALQNGRNLQIVIDNISTKASAADPAKGTVGYISSTTADPFKSSSESPCDFYEGVAAGKIWVTFVCPKVDADMATCAINQSYAKFENCEGATNEEE